MQIGLERQALISPTIFEAETQFIFARNWLCGPRTGHLAAGEFITFELECHPVLIVRSRDGRLRGFHNVCRHRGAIICDASEGRFPASHGSSSDSGCWTCPYHAWSYGDDGQLLRAPNMQGTSPWNKSDYGLLPLACEEWNGYAMLHLDPTASFTNDYQPIIDRTAAWQAESLVPGYALRYEVAANWKLLFHNYSECYHCPTVHPALNRLTPYKSAANDLLDGAFLGGPMLLNEGVQSMTLDGQSVGPPLPGLSAEQQRQVAYYTIFPTMFFSPHPDYVMIHRLYRLAVDQTEIHCDFLVPAHSNCGPSSRLMSAVKFWDQTNRQDWDVCQRVQQGARSSAFQPSIYTPLESVLPHFDRHYRRQMGG